MFSDYNRIKVEINNRKTMGKISKHMVYPYQPMGQRKLKNTQNENENTAYQHMLSTTKTGLRGKFIAINAYVRK